MARQTKPPETESEAQPHSTFDPLLSDQLDEFLRHLREFLEEALERNLARLNSQADATKQMTSTLLEFARKTQECVGTLETRGMQEFWFQIHHPASTARPLSDCLASVDSADGRQRVFSQLEKELFPHYEAVGDDPDLLLRIDSDGTRTFGRFVDRKFQADE